MKNNVLHFAKEKNQNLQKLRDLSMIPKAGWEIVTKLEHCSLVHFQNLFFKIVLILHAKQQGKNSTCSLTGNI